jgi:hypothetical protein
MKRYSPDDVDSDQIKSLLTKGYKPAIFINAAGKPTRITFSKASQTGDMEIQYTSDLYSSYALIKIKHILEGTDGDKRTRENLSRAKLRKQRNSYLP